MLMWEHKDFPFGHFQSPIHSDQAPLDTLYVEGSMLITKFSYLNVFDAILNFDLMRDTTAYLTHNTGTNYTYQNMAVVIDSRMTIQIRCSLPVSITCPSSQC